LSPSGIVALNISHLLVVQRSRNQRDWIHHCSESWFVSEQSLKERLEKFQYGMGPLFRRNNMLNY